MSDTELQDALHGCGFRLMPHHGPGPRWGAVGGLNADALICATKDSGYTVRGTLGPVVLEVRCATPAAVLPAWGVVERVVAELGEKLA